MSRKHIGGGHVLTPPSRQPATSVAQLRSRVRGQVLVREDSDWDLARQAWNLAVDQQPAMVTLPESPEDIVNIVRFARTRDLRVAAQGAGHNASPLGSLADTILLRTSRMGQIEISPASGKARVDAGVSWGEVIPATSKYGLAPLAGTSDDLGVVGYSLGGGIGWLARLHGTAAEHITAVEIVIADGSLVRADADHHADLFWALRGGGGSFGVVTAMEFDLLPVSHAYAGGMYWPAERAYEILAAWTDWTKSAPDDVTSMGRLLNLPQVAGSSKGVRRRQMVGVEAAFLGQEIDYLRLLIPLRDLRPDIDTFASISASLLGTVHMDPTDPIPWASDGRLLKEFPKWAAEALVIAAGPISDPPMLSIEVRHLGGRLAKPSPQDGAFSLADAAYALYAVGRAWNPDTRAAVEVGAQRVVAALSPWSAGRSYLNFTERPGDAVALFPRRTYDRLRLIKTKYDSENMFRSNHPIPPA